MPWDKLERFTHSWRPTRSFCSASCSDWFIRWEILTYIHFYMRLFVPTPSKDAALTLQSLVFLLCSSDLCVTNRLVWRVLIQSTRFTAIMCWQAGTRPLCAILVFWSRTWLSLHPQCCIESIVFLPSKHSRVRERDHRSETCKMSGTR
jgi:hypothetical protein